MFTLLFGQEQTFGEIRWLVFIAFTSSFVLCWPVGRSIYTTPNAEKEVVVLCRKLE